MRQEEQQKNKHVGIKENRLSSLEFLIIAE